jgi:trehalose 6-phosphate synthase
VTDCKEGDDVGERSVFDALDGRELLVASNREPYTHGYDGDEVTVSQPAGGLTAALDPIMQELSGTWVAWGSGDADFEVADDGGRVGVPPEDPSYTIQRLHLSERELSGYYYGYSNQVLWPLCHGMPTRATFDEECWGYYQQVNETFADAIVTCADDDDPVVWFQDYHLALAPRLVRDRLPDAFLTQFWHIPWPSWETFRSCPEHRELLEGLLANDLLGFHSESYCESFCECVAAAFEDAAVDEEAGLVTYEGHTTRIQSRALGIDAEVHAERAASDQVEELWETFASRHDLGDQVAVGVDRLDYTKGILQRLDALEWLWEHRPDRRGELTYVQKGSESRTRIDEYQELQDGVERRVREINDRFATDDWTPVVYVDDHYSREALAALYRHADVGLVSPLRDGMNLVAKEYVASQFDNDGVLVLSEFAGAAESLGDASLVVNPNDTEEFATTIEAALSMPERTRKRRMRALRRRVHAEDNDAWVNDQFNGIATDRDDEPEAGTPNWQSTPVSIWGRKQWLADTLKRADGLFVMSDFDGTVADIVDDPEEAEIRDRARECLEATAAHPRAEVAIVSGRAVDDVRERAAVEDAYFAGNHGLELHDGDERSVHSSAHQVQKVLPVVSNVVEREFADDNGVFVEDKGITATVHYRQADCDGEDVRDAVDAALAEHDEYDALRVTEGKKVVELRPDVDWGKGATVELLRERFTPEDEEWLMVYVGDDTTDEAAFEVLDGDGVAVAVGSDRDATAAPYVVSDPREVTDFFSWLAGEGLANLDARRREDAVVEPQ